MAQACPFYLKESPNWCWGGGGWSWNNSTNSWVPVQTSPPLPQQVSEVMPEPASLPTDPPTQISRVLCIRVELEKRLTWTGSLLEIEGNLFITDPKSSWGRIAYHSLKWRSSAYTPPVFFWYFSASDQVRMLHSLKWTLPVIHIPRVSIIFRNERVGGRGVVYVITCQVFTVYLTGKSTMWLLTSCTVKI